MRVDLLTNGIETDITDECSTKTDKKFEVTVPENYSSVAEQYSITVWPEENPGIKDVINITVPVPGSSSGNQDDNTENSRYEPQEQSGNSEYEPEESYNETSEWPEPEEPSYEPDFPDESYDDESEFPFESREESESEMSEPVTEDENSENSETTSVPSEEESSSIP